MAAVLTPHVDVDWQVRAACWTDPLSREHGLHSQTFRSETR